MKRAEQMNAENSGEERKHVMDVVLIVIAVTLVIFTTAMIITFCMFQSVPDTLITCVFAAATGECGVMGWIKTTKERQETRKWELEDREAEKGESK